MPSNSVQIPNVSTLLVKYDPNKADPHRYVCFRHDLGEDHGHEKVWMRARVSDTNLLPAKSASNKYYTLTFDRDSTVRCSYCYDNQNVEMDVDPVEFKRMFNASRPVRSKADKSAHSDMSSAVQTVDAESCDRSVTAVTQIPDTSSKIDKLIADPVKKASPQRSEADLAFIDAINDVSCDDLLY